MPSLKADRRDRCNYRAPAIEILRCVQGGQERAGSHVRLPHQLFNAVDRSTNLLTLSGFQCFLSWLVRPLHFGRPD